MEVGAQVRVRDLEAIRERTIGLGELWGGCAA